MDKWEKVTEEESAKMILKAASMSKLQSIFKITETTLKAQDQQAIFQHFAEILSVLFKEALQKVQRETREEELPSIEYYRRGQKDCARKCAEMAKDLMAHQGRMLNSEYGKQIANAIEQRFLKEKS